MSSRNFQKPIRIKGKKLVLTKKMIEDAQSQTKSNMAAARWLSISYLTYRKYAKTYGLFEKHLNPAGVGIKKGYRMRAGYIKKRLIKEKWVEEECNSCGYNEIIMGKDSVALRLDYEDGDVINNTLENLRLLCPNCFLSHNGHMPSSERFYK